MTTTQRRVLLAATVAVFVPSVTPFASAQTPSVTASKMDNIKPVPPPGIAVPDADRAELTAGVEALGKEIDSLRADLKNKPELLRFLPDVQIYYNAVHYALTYNEFFNPKQIVTARQFLAKGNERAKALRAGTAPWTTQPGVIALGYVSRIDGSIQPYGLVVPKEWTNGDKTPRRLEIFCHGRGETLNEIAFIDSHQHGNGGDFTPPGALVLHPYGRYCNASRYAGEVDTFEAIDDLKGRYSIDPDRVVMRGFSMGGASSWQYATHHADQWAAASPGAGFTETATYTKAFAEGKTPPTWYEQKLWHWYDPVDYAVNLAQCPTVGYSGEIDPQKKAADNMEDAMAKEGLKLARVIGAKAGHKYTPKGKAEINAFIDPLVAKGRDRKPSHLRFTTWTLRYNQMDWLTVDALEHHWERARVEADLIDSTQHKVSVKSENVTGLTFDTTLLGGGVGATINGQYAGIGSQFRKDAAGKWSSIDRADVAFRLQKIHGLQGPIDDAFMDRFVMVRPTGKPINATLGAWVTEEMGHAAHEWRGMFRAEAPFKNDTAITDSDIASSNLILWGDPSSNAILARIADRLPIRWNRDGSIKIGAKTYPSGTTVPIFIYPNPLNPSHYVVVNSGHTFREAHYASNALQTPKLPDWAIIDITTPPDKRTPGRVVDADFFDESWQIAPPHTVSR